MKFDDICKQYEVDIFDKDLLDIFLNDKELEFEIEKEQNEIIGYISYKNLELSNDVYHLFVNENFRKKGIASKFLNKIYNKDISVEVDEENIKAINLYKKLGFKEIKKISNYYKNGNNALVLLKCYN